MDHLSLDSDIEGHSRLYQTRLYRQTLLPSGETKIASLRQDSPLQRNGR
jgi:hypothetical protein